MNIKGQRRQYKMHLGFSRKKPFALKFQDLAAYLSCRGLDDSALALPVSIQVHGGTILVLFILWVNIEQLLL